MGEALWIEVDEDAAILRASDSVKRLLEPMFGPDLGLKAILPARPDIAAAIGRKSGRARVGLGHGQSRTQFDLTMDEGGQGCRLVLEEAPELDPAVGFRDWAEETQLGVVLLDADGFVEWANRAFGEQVGYPSEELAGVSFGSFRAQGEQTERAVRSIQRALVGTGAWTGTVAFRRSDGTTFPGGLTYTALENGDGVTTHFVVTCEDQQEESELELLDALETSTALLNRMGTGFAHDINNLAAELIALAEIASDDTAAPPVPDTLRRVAELGQAAGEVGRQLLVLAGEGTGAPPSDLAQAARDLCWLLVRASSRTRTIEVNEPSNGANRDGSIWVGVRTDAVLRALLRPALRAVAELPPDRVIRVSAHVEGDQGVLSLTYEADSTERARLRLLISDGAVTSRAGNILRTRAMGAGVQLQLVTDHDADVSIRACVPLSDGPAISLDDATGERRRWKRVLVVEDNEPLRDLMAHALAPLFDEVEGAGDGVKALERLVELDGDLDLAIVDLMMPRLGGGDVVKVARARWPNLPFIAVSGASPDDMAKLDPGVSEFLLKPFKLRDLRRSVYRVLRSR